MISKLKTSKGFQMNGMSRKGRKCEIIETLYYKGVYIGDLYCSVEWVQLLWDVKVTSRRYVTSRVYISVDRASRWALEQL